MTTSKTLLLREDFPLLAREAARAFVALPSVEWRRRHEGPEPLLARYRDLGRIRRRRPDSERALLRSAIGFLDRLFPGGGNCYRRVLLEIALDAGAAEEPFVMGFRLTDAGNDGHAWLESQPPEDGEASYDIVVRL